MRNVVLVATALHSLVSPLAAEQLGRSLLEARCGRCHAVVAGADSKLVHAPNLWDVLQTYSTDRLELELAEGIGSRHPNMPQIQFTAEEIVAVRVYLDGR